MRQRYCSYQTNRGKVSVWNCDICAISWRLAKNNTSVAPHNAFGLRSRRSRDRFRISNVRLVSSCSIASVAA